MSRKAAALPLSYSDETSVSQTPAEAWVDLFGCSAPGRMDALVAQAVAWQRQMLVHGDVAPAIARDLAVISADASARRTVRARDGGLPDTGVPTVALDLASCLPEAPSSAANGASCDDPETPRHGVRATLPTPPPRRARPAPLPPASSQLLVGTRFVKSYGGQTHVVEVTADGMLYAGEHFASLSAVAKHITGTHWNGLLFFGLRRRKTYPAKAAAHG